MVTLFEADAHPVEPWCRVATDMLAEDDVVRFPYAILEVKLSGVDYSPPWVQDMLNTCECTQVYKFSKFQHGMAFLHRNLIPVVPHWFEDFYQLRIKEQILHRGKSAHHPRISHAPETPSMSVSCSVLLQSRGSEFTDIEEMPLQAAKRSGYHAVRDVRLIEPKLFFANERTFIHYAEHGVICIALIHFMVTLGSQECRILGFLLAPFTITYLIWCYMEYVNRDNKLKDRVAVERLESRLDNVRGPHVVCVLACSMIASSFALSMSSFSFTRSY